MEQKPIIPYSRIIGDDGAFDKAKKDLSNFLDFIIKEGEKLKGISLNVDTKDTKALIEIGKEVEELKNKKLEYEVALKALLKTEKLLEKVTKEQRKGEVDKIKALADAEIQLTKYRKELAQLQKIEKASPTQNKKNAEAITELKLRIKDLTNEYNKNQKEVLERGKLTLKETKLLKALEVVENKQIDTLQEVRDRMSALRLVVQNTSLSTEEGRQTIDKYNKEIDELTQLLSDNSDEFIKNKINIGNYKESIKEALNETGLFKTNIAILDTAFDKLIDTLFSSKEAVEANTVAVNRNTESLGVLAKINGFLARIFKKNIATVNANTEAVVVNTGAVTAETEAVVLNTEATAINTGATNVNTQATTRNTGAVGKLIKSFKGLNTVLKASIILGIIALLGSLFSIFKQGRAGVVATEKAMARFAVISKVVITTLADFGKGLFSFFGAIGSSIGNLFLKMEKFALNMELLFKKPTAFSKQAKAEVSALEAQIASLDKQIQDNAKKNGDSYEEAWGKMGDAITTFGKRYDDAVASIKTLDEGIIRGFEIGDQIKKAELAIISLQKTVRGFEMMAEDDTLSLVTQLKATELLLVKRIALLKKESEINGLSLEQANAKARADLQANATTIGARANAIAGIKNEAKFTEALLQLNIDLSERKGENPLDDEFLQSSVEALKVYKQGLAEIQIAKQENAEKIRKIDRDIFEQNLDLLIDLIEKEKQLSEQQVNDTALAYQSRLNEFERFRGKFKDNVQKELDEFNLLAVKSATQLKAQLGDLSLDPEQAKLIRLELEKLENLDLQIKFNADNSFEVLNDGVALSIDDIKSLNKELQSIGLAEIPINRFREFTQEMQAWLKDTREQELALKKVGVAIEQLQNENLLSEVQLAEFKALNEEIRKLSEPTTLNPLKGEYDKRLKEIEDLEKRKTEITEEAEQARIQIRLNTLDEEEKIIKAQAEREYFIQKNKEGKLDKLTEDDIKKAYEKSEDLLKIQEERLALQTQLETTTNEKLIEAQRVQTEKLKAEWERFKKDLFQVFDLIADKFVEMANKQVQTTQERVSKQEKATDDQRARAQSGLENTLAFEEEQLAKREAQAQKAKRKAERLEKIKALWTSYQSYASDPENKNGEALQKTLRDFAILEAIQASFGDGGLVADKIPTDGRGIIRGRSHKGNGGGIPVLVEGNEGFFSGREVENLGKDNFRAFKSMLGKGKVSPDLFKNQRSEFMQAMPIIIDNSGIERGLEEVRNEIRNKPTQTVNVTELVSGFLKITEETKTPTKKVRNSYIIKKPKF
ncbi:tape measure protein [Flavobacterium sp. phage 1/32]|nr:tape measure protein [Flavobacterium sp. phage 1/32]